MQFISNAAAATGKAMDGVEIKLLLEGEDCLRFPDDPYIKPYNEYGEVSAYRTDGTIKGVVELTATTKLPAFVSCVTVAFEQFSTYRNSIEGHQTAFREWTVANSEGLKISSGATMRLPFAVDLNEVYPQDALRPTNAGTTYSLRHQIYATAKKPWYSFSGGAVEGRLPVQLLHVRPAPTTSVGATPHALHLADVKGSATFDYGRNCANVKSVIAGAVVFADLKEKIHFAKLELIKGEFAENASADTAVWTSVLYPPSDKAGWRKNRVLKEKGDDGLGNEVDKEVIEMIEPGFWGGDAFVPPVDGVEGFEEDASFAVHLDLAALEESERCGRALTPSYRRLVLENVPAMSADQPEPPASPKGSALSPTAVSAGGARSFDADDDWDTDVTGDDGVIETAYFLKLTAINAAGDKKWNTNKIFLYDADNVATKRTVDIDL